MPSSGRIRQMLKNPCYAGAFAYGKTAATNGKPTDGKTLFEIGSITKTFTCTLLADAVVNGKMRLEDPVQKYLPDTVKLPKCGAREMTLLDVATHMRPRIAEFAARRLLR